MNFMYWILSHTQLLFHIYINGAIIVGGLVALIHFITFIGDKSLKLTTADLISYHISFVTSFLIWPAELIRIVGAVIYTIKERLKNKKLRNQRRGFY